MAERLTHEQFDLEIEEAMKPPSGKQGQTFTPGIEALRETMARKRLSAGQQQEQLPVAR